MPPEDRTPMTILVLFGLTIVCLVFIVCYREIKVSKQFNLVVQSCTYNVGDVRAFIDQTDYTERQFVNSPAVRKQFERWVNGEVNVAKKTQNTTMFIPLPMPSSN